MLQRCFSVPDEVGLTVYDCIDEEDAIEKVREFIEFLNANDPYVE
jgi:hypothetical protein